MTKGRLPSYTINRVTGEIKFTPGMELVERSMIKELRQITTNGWIKQPDIEVYIRKSQRVLNGRRQSTVELANWSFTSDDHSCWRETVYDIECYAAGIHHTVYVENVLQPEYCRFFEKRGYYEVPGGFGTRSFFLERK